MAEESGPRIISPGVFARVFSAWLGVWLIISAFMWPHTAAQRANSWIVGILAIVFSVIAMSSPRARYLTTALAVWLFVSNLTFHAINLVTPWNNGFVAIAMFVASLVPFGSTEDRSPRHQRPSPAGHPG
jgi:hypothetical protein